jgi:hypothetical protein
MDLPFRNNTINRLRDTIGMVIQSKVAEQHSSGKDQSCRVGLVLALDIETDMAASGFKDSDFAAHVAARDDTRSSNKASSDVGQDTTVKIGHDHNIKLLWPGNALHRCVVDDHVIAGEHRVVLGDPLDCAAEKTVCELHDVGLVNNSDLLPVVGKGKGKGKLGNALGLGARNDLERLDNPADGLVLETGVFAFGVLSNNADVDVLVACLVTGNVLDEDNRGIDVELLSKSDVE